MYLLRRAAVRAITAQSSRQLSTLRPTASRVTLLDSAKPSLYRSFHQTRIWRAEEGEKKAEELKDEAASAATAAEEAAEAAQSAADEAVVQAAAEPATQDAQDVASSASAAADAAAASASTAQSAAPSSFPPRQSANFPPRDAPTGSSFASPTPGPVIYIGNLFFEVTTAQLESEFSRYGRITNSRIVTDARGLSKGFGYIEFDSQESADRAVRELDQKVFQGRRMAVQYHVRREPRSRTQGGSGRPPNTPSKTLFIGNMSYQMSDRDLNDLFREIRDVLDVRVAIDRRSGQPRGFAHADFVDVPSAQRAKEHLEQKVVYGRQLRVDFSQSSSGRETGMQSS